MMNPNPNMDLETQFQMEQKRIAMMNKIVKNPNYDEVYRIVQSLKSEEKNYLYPESYGEFVEPKFLVARQLYFLLPNNISSEELSQMSEEMIKQIRLPVGFADAFLLNPVTTSIAHLFVAISPNFRKKYISPILINNIIRDLKRKNFQKLILTADSSSPSYNDIIKMANRNKFVRERSAGSKIIFGKRL